MTRRTLLLLTLAVALLALASVWAWNPGPSTYSYWGPHQVINYRAWIAFLTDAENDPRYGDASFTDDPTYHGAYVPVGGKWSLTSGETDFKASEWLEHGGFAADQPEVLMAMRHFYDPASLDGAPWLTDMLPDPINPHVDAKTWALSHPDNLQNWNSAVDGYKNALETPSLHDQFLAHALLSLGVVMHGLADMTQPAHVRNDTHARCEPIEDAVGPDTVNACAGGAVSPLCDFSADNPGQLFDAVAHWTQTYFYSDDTIGDASVPLYPNNGKPIYPHPTLNDLEWRAHWSDPARQVGYSKATGAPIVERTLTANLFGDTVPTGYCVPMEFAYQQAQTLIPVAVNANKCLLRLFFPNLSVDAHMVFTADKKHLDLIGEMKHDVTNDMVWINKKIKFNGSGILKTPNLGTPDLTDMIDLGTVTFHDGVITDFPQQVADGRQFYLSVQAGCRWFWVYLETPEPFVEMTLDKSELEPGEATTLTWKSYNASRVYWTDFGATTLDGSMTVGVPRDYTLVVANEGGDAGGETATIKYVNTSALVVGTWVHDEPNYHVVLTINADKTYRWDAVSDGTPSWHAGTCNWADQASSGTDFVYYTVTASSNPGYIGYEDYFEILYGNYHAKREASVTTMHFTVGFNKN